MSNNVNLNVTVDTKDLKEAAKGWQRYKLVDAVGTQVFKGLDRVLWVGSIFVLVMFACNYVSYRHKNEVEMRPHRQEVVRLTNECLAWQRKTNNHDFTCWMEVSRQYEAATGIKVNFY